MDELENSGSDAEETAAKEEPKEEPKGEEVADETSKPVEES